MPIAGETAGARLIEASVAVNKLISIQIQSRSGYNLGLPIG